MSSNEQALKDAVNADSQQTSLSSFSFFSSQQNSAAPTEIVQLLPASCTAFSCGQLFTKVLQETTQGSPPPYMQTVRLFEIVIYPEIWEFRYGFADEMRAMAYLMPFLTRAPKFIAGSELQSFTATNNDMFFRIHQMKVGKHTVFIEKEGDEFLCDGRRYPTIATNLPKDEQIEKVIKIKKTDLNVAAVQARYLEYKDKIEEALQHFDPNNPLHIYYACSLMLCQKEFPEYHSKLVNIITLHPRMIIQNGKCVKEFLENFPEMAAFLENHIRHMQEKFFENFREIYVMMQNFPSLKPILVEMLIQHSDKYIEEFHTFKDALDFFPDLIGEAGVRLAIKTQDHFFKKISDMSSVFYKYQLEKTLREMFLANPNKFVTSVHDMVVAARLFPEHKELLRKDLLANQEKYLLDIGCLISALNLFPQDKQVFSDFFKNNMEKIIFSQEFGIDVYRWTKHYFLEHLQEVRRRMLENLEQYLENLSQIKTMLDCCPELKTPIAEIILKAPEKFVPHDEISEVKAFLGPFRPESEPSQEQAVVFGCMI